MPSIPIYDPVVKEFTTSESVWDVAHGFGRTINAEFYDTSGCRIFPKEEEIDTNNYRGTFYTKGALFPIKGKVIIS